MADFGEHLEKKKGGGHVNRHSLRWEGTDWLARTRSSSSLNLSSSVLSTVILEVAAMSLIPPAQSFERLSSTVIYKSFSHRAG